MTKEWEDYEQFKDYDNLNYENRGNDNYFVDIILKNGEIHQMYKRDANTLEYTFLDGTKKRVHFIFSSKFLGKKREVWASDIKKIRLTHYPFERYKKHQTYYGSTCKRCGNHIPVGEASNIKCDVISFKYNMAKGKYPKPKVEIPFNKNEDLLIPFIF